MVALSDISEYFTVAVVDGGGHPVVVVKGEIDLRAADEFWAVIQRALAQDPDHLVVDMADTAFMDSSGLNVLLRAYGAVGERRDALVLRAPSPAVLRVMELAGVEDMATYDPPLTPS